MDKQPVSQCLTCKNLASAKISKYSCPAYPQGIPREILYNIKIHNEVLNEQIGKTIYKSK